MKAKKLNSGATKKPFAVGKQNDHASCEAETWMFSHPTTGQLWKG